MPDLDNVDLEGQLYVNGAWTTYPGYSAEGWEYTIGPDVETGTRPNKIAFTFQNTDLNLDPEKADSPLYGQIGLNTPMRLLLDGSVVAQCSASSWVPDANQEHDAATGYGRAWVNVTAEGLLHTVQRWSDKLDSALTRQTLSYGTALMGYWPIEDPSGAAQLSQRAPRGGIGNYSGGTRLASVDGPAGSSPIAQIGASTSMGGVFANAAASNGWQVCFTFQADAAPSSATYLPIFGFHDTLGRTWWWNVNNSAMGIDVYSQITSALVVNHTVGNGGIDLTTATRFRIKATPTGGGTSTLIEYAWYQADGSVIFGTSTTMAENHGAPTAWFVRENAWNTAGGIGQVFAVDDPTIDLTGGYDAAAAFNGYRGERAIRRWIRLMGELGLPWFFNGTDVDWCPRMGPQKPDTALNLLKEAVMTDGGIMYDSGSSYAIVMRPYHAIVHRTPVLALEKGGTGDHIAPPFRRATDDHGVANDVTVENRDGMKATAVLETGPMSIEAPPTGIGRYIFGGDLKLNYRDPLRLAGRANWEMRKGTLRRPRYPKLTIWLHKHPDLKATVQSMRPGDTITVSGEEPDTITLRVISIERAGDAVHDRVTFNCLPAEPYDVLRYATSGNKWSSSSTTLRSSISAGATTVPIRTRYEVETWSTTGVPYDWRIAGERVTVTAMSAPTYSGGWYEQDATVTRAVNGISKAQTSGAQVTLWQVRRFGNGSEG